MANQLRKGVETLKLFYINQIIQSDHSIAKEELDSMTLSELDHIFKKVYPSKLKSKLKKHMLPNNRKNK